MSILIPGQELASSSPFPLHARSGWQIPTARPALEDIRVLQIRSQELHRWRPNAQLRAVSSFPYNCVGLIFASRRAWIEIDHIYDILREDGYKQVRLEDIMIGDVVLYKNYRGEPVHVALVVTVDRVFGLNVKVLSKWGVDGEFIHFIEDVPPFLGTPSEVYTERPI